MDVTESRLVSREGRAVRRRMCSAIDDVGSIAVQGVACGVEGVGKVVGLARLASGEGGSLEGRWEAGEGSVLVEIAEEAGSHGRDITCIEASRWETVQRTIGVEVSKEVTSYGSNMTRVEASDWKARQGATMVEIVEEIVSNGSPNIARVETSAWQARQGAAMVEVGEEDISYDGDLARVEASLRKTR